MKMHSNKQKENVRAIQRHVHDTLKHRKRITPKRIYGKSINSNKKNSIKSHKLIAIVDKRQCNRIYQVIFEMSIMLNALSEENMGKSLFCIQF